MTIKINADTTDGLKLVSDTSGIVDIQSNGTTKMTVGTTIDVQGNELVLDADADTSIHADTDDQIDFKTGGTDRMTIDSSGNVGIGTSSPDTTLEVSAGNPGIKLTDTNNTISQTGLVSNISAEDSAGTQTWVVGRQFGSTAFNISHLESSAMKFNIGGSERMQIDSDGDLLVATTSNVSASGGAFQVKSRTGSEHVASFQNGVSNGGWGIPFFNVAGSEVGSIRWTASVTNFNTSSDYRLKENVNYTFDATTEVKRLKPCKFNFIGESETVEGFLAHEVSDVVPVAVTGTKDAVDDNGDAIYQGIDQSKLVPLLVKTIQELEERITALENN